MSGKSRAFARLHAKAEKAKPGYGELPPDMKAYVLSKLTPEFYRKLEQLKRDNEEWRRRRAVLPSEVFKL